MAKVFVIRAWHHAVSGVRTAVCLDRNSADQAAAGIVNELLEDWWKDEERAVADARVEKTPAVANTWRDRLLSLQLARLVEYHNDADAAVAILRDHGLGEDADLSVGLDALREPMTSLLDDDYGDADGMGFMDVTVQETDLLEFGNAPSPTLGDLLSVVGWAKQFADDWIETAGEDTDDVERQKAAAAADLVDRVEDALPAFWAMLGGLETPMANALGAMRAAEEQIEQMRGMFDDDDDTIQAAADALDEAGADLSGILKRIRAAEPLPAAPKPTIVVTLSGGCIIGSISNVEDAARILVVDYDQDGTPDDETVDMSRDATSEKRASVWLDFPALDADWVAHVEDRMKVLDEGDDEGDDA